MLALFVAGALAASSPARGHTPLDRPSPRKTTPKDVAIDFEKVVLSNGLTVLMSPDPGVSGVVVDMSFHAGSQYEPPGRSGLAHLVEHLMAAGSAPDTDYQAILETRGARDFNAFTSMDLMIFRVVVPPGQLPLALWVAEDRLGTLPGRLDQAELDRTRRIVAEERVEHVDDAPFGSLNVALFKKLYPAPHPMHGMTLGAPEELAALTVADIREFVGRCLVPSNGILTLVGNFDPAVARTWLEKTVARLPPGQPVKTPDSLPRMAQDVTVAVTEQLSRRPRVTFAWRFSELPRETADALDFGALLLTIYTDGAFGIDVEAGFAEYSGGAMFRLDVTLAHAKAKRDARDDAESLLRYLTRAVPPNELVDATFLAWDRVTLARLDSPTSRAALLTFLEYLVKRPSDIARYNERQWDLKPDQIQSIARAALERAARLTVHARPTRPRPPRVERE
ncbi:MAG: M16 family metallopeptidase [Myxococcaceae bacterium]